MIATVTETATEVFNRITGHRLTKEQGSLFAALAFQNGFDWQSRTHNFQNLAGCQFGRLTVVGADINSKAGQVGWLCRCECGGMSTVLAGNLRTGKQRSCGCLRDEVRSARIAAMRKPESEKRANGLIRKARYNASEKGKSSKQRYFQRHKASALARSKAWSHANPESGRAAVRNRRAKLRRAAGTHCSEDIQRIGVEQGWCCAGCSKDIRGHHQVDHVVAVSKGGSNGPDNLQLLCRPCNTRKGTKSLLTFMAEIRPDLFNETTKGGVGFYEA